MTGIAGIYSKWLFGCGLVIGSFVPLVDAHAQTFTVLHAFMGGTDGGSPQSTLIFDGAGYLYGTTANGGGKIGCKHSGCGAVFKLSPDGTVTLLHAFVGKRYGDGAEPRGGVFADQAGSLFGTTVSGGLRCHRQIHIGYGCGTVFELAPDGSETVLYAFKAERDGIFPFEGVTSGKNGNLYGTTNIGGIVGCSSLGCGTVFKVSPDGREKVLHAFTGGSDGGFPVAGLISDSAENLYGTASAGGNSGCGGSGCGTVFKLTSNGTQTVLYTFTGGSDGASPAGGLVIDAAGNLYGTTAGGGGIGCGGYGCGTVFKLAPDGTQTVLHAFGGGSDGNEPLAQVIADSAGNFYGTTYVGGGTECGGTGCGTVFKIASNGVETVLHAFAGRSDGQYLSGGVVADKNGNLFGTASGGGEYGYGTVWEIKQ